MWTLRDSFSSAYVATRYEYYVMVLGFDESYAYQLARETLSRFIEQCRLGLIDGETYDGEYFAELVLSAFSDKALQELE